MKAAPHDLLRIGGPAALVCDGAPPAWVSGRPAAAATVVVRRAEPRGGLLPVGVRGGARPERFAAWVAPERVMARIRPEALAARRAWRDPPARRVPALEALEAVAALLDPLGLAWGPVGGAGFELATGVPCLTPASDLDLVLRAPRPLARAAARRLQAALAELSVRTDVQLETPAGAVALAEHAAGAPRVLLRAVTGPRLVADPWVGA